MTAEEERYRNYARYLLKCNVTSMLPFKNDQFPTKESRPEHQMLADISEGRLVVAPINVDQSVIGEKSVETPEGCTYRCYHCKRVFPEGTDHFGKYEEMPKCIEMPKKGMYGGYHDPYIRVRKDVWEKAQEGLKAVEPKVVTQPVEMCASFSNQPCSLSEPCSFCKKVNAEHDAARVMEAQREQKCDACKSGDHSKHDNSIYRLGCQNDNCSCSTESQAGVTLCGRTKEEWIQHLHNLFSAANAGEDIPFNALYEWPGTATAEDREGAIRGE